MEKEKLDTMRPNKSAAQLALIEAKETEKRQIGRKAYRILNGIVITKNPGKYGKAILDNRPLKINPKTYKYNG
jgi:hypothetical protein